MRELPQILPLVIAPVALMAAVLLRQRRTRTAVDWPRPARALLPGVTGMVAAREVRERVRARVFRAGTLLIVAAMAAAIVIPVLAHGTSAHPNPHAGAVGTADAGLVLVLLMLTQYNTWTLTGVMEEKSSRVIEVLLAAARPAQLFTGKVLGIGLAAFCQVAIVAGAATVLAQGTHSGLLNGTAPAVLLAALLWLVLGYAFYCWVYAAAGSLAERRDQVQSLAFPLTLPVLAGFFVAQTALVSGHASVLTEVFAYLPPTAPFAMPVLVALRIATWWQFTISVVISAACTIAAARLAAGIYRRAILRTGRRVRLREVLIR